LLRHLADPDQIFERNGVNVWTNSKLTFAYQ